ncbi:hypothetical protein ACEWY4_025136 [Coilia grayii]|uniref:Uncharacterized protein n=1 Tax=Coilia grayii TaxID=363190 RepID=A0ABD1IX17_9TELE
MEENYDTSGKGKKHMPKSEKSEAAEKDRKEKKSKDKTKQTPKIKERREHEEKCSRAGCKKWRRLQDNVDPSFLPKTWTCSQNTDSARSSCDAPEESCPECKEEEFYYCSLVPGSLVWAQQAGYPWWPAMIERDPVSGDFLQFKTKRDPFPCKCHVTYLGRPVSRAWVQRCRVRDYCELPEVAALREVRRPAKQRKKKRGQGGAEEPKGAVQVTGEVETESDTENTEAGQQREENDGDAGEKCGDEENASLTEEPRTAAEEDRHTGDEEREKGGEEEKVRKSPGTEKKENDSVKKGPVKEEMTIKKQKNQKKGADLSGKRETTGERGSTFF